MASDSTNVIARNDHHRTSSDAAAKYIDISADVNNGQLASDVVRDSRTSTSGHSDVGNGPSASVTVVRNGSELPRTVIDAAGDAVQIDRKGQVTVASTVLELGNVEEDLSALVDQKTSGEIGEADFKRALLRLLDIKHARSVAIIQREARQRKMLSKQRQSSWAAGMTDAAAADRRDRRAAAADAAWAAEEGKSSSGNRGSGRAPRRSGGARGDSPHRSTRRASSSSTGDPGGGRGNSGNDREYEHRRRGGSSGGGGGSSRKNRQGSHREKERHSHRGGEGSHREKDGSRRASPRDRVSRDAIVEGGGGRGEGGDGDRDGGVADGAGTRANASRSSRGEMLVNFDDDDVYGRRSPRGSEDRTKESNWHASDANHQGPPRVPSDHNHDRTRRPSGTRIKGTPALRGTPPTRARRDRTTPAEGSKIKTLGVGGVGVRRTQSGGEVLGAEAGGGGEREQEGSSETTSQHAKRDAVRLGEEDLVVPKPKLRVKKAHSVGGECIRTWPVDKLVDGERWTSQTRPAAGGACEGVAEDATAEQRDSDGSLGAVRSARIEVADGAGRAVWAGKGVEDDPGVKDDPGECAGGEPFATQEEVFPPKAPTTATRGLVDDSSRPSDGVVEAGQRPVVAKVSPNDGFQGFGTNAEQPRQKKSGCMCTVS